MGEGFGGNIAKIGERFLEDVPGFALVAIVLGALLPCVFPLGAEGPSESGAVKITRQALPVIVLVLAWVGHFLGHYVDPLLFDPIWGSPGIRNRSESLERILAFKRLDQSRTGLADQWERPVTGIFAKAQDLMSNTEVWHGKIKWPLEWSKAFRSLAILGVIALTSWARGRWIAVIFVFSVVLFSFRPDKRWSGSTKRRWTALQLLVFLTALVCLLIRLLLFLVRDHIQLRMFRPLILVAVILVSMVLYLGLRIRHVRTLYESARNLKFGERGGIFCAGQRIVPLRNVLLVADNAVGYDGLKDADCFVQSQALMHVKLSTTLRSSPPLCCKTIRIFKNQLEDIQLASQVYRSLHLDPADPREFDLVIEYLDEDAPGDYKLPELGKKLNGVI